MTALVTGANGFIGSNLCRHLLDRGHKVTGLVRRQADRRFLAGLSSLRIAVGDITDRANLAAAMEGVEIVYHVAALASDWGARDAFHAANVVGVRNVLEAACRSKVRRVVHTSSVSVYGFPSGVDIPEDMPFTPRPRDLYVSSKVAGERLAMSFNGRGVEVAVVRPGGVYGPNDRTTTLPLADALRAGKFAHVDHGRHVMAPVYVDNLVDMMRLAGSVPAAAGQAFNAVDDGRVTWHEFVGWMCADLGCPPPPRSVPARLAWIAAVATESVAKSVGMKQSPLINTYRVRAVMQDNHYSTAKAKRLLGWRPVVTTREGVKRAVAWYLREPAPRERHATCEARPA